MLSHAQYNALWIPDTLTGPNFSLTLKDTFAQLKTGNQTITGGINQSRFWGPTLIMYKGQQVQMQVKNKLNDSSTIHWHGMHLPAVMDGGPIKSFHQAPYGNPTGPLTTKPQRFGTIRIYMK